MGSAAMPELVAEGAVEARAGLDFGLSRTERRTFLALVAGHALFVLALFTVAEHLGEYGLYLITPLFGLPLLVTGPKARFAARALVLLVGFPLLHFAAATLARQCYRVPFAGEGFTDSLWLCGAIGGVAGAAGSFALCALCGIFRPGAGTMAVAGTIVLAVLGGVGLSAAVSFMPGDAVAPLLLLYTPWQLAFAYFLAKTLTPGT
jgi:hypothetical protein